MRGDDQADRGVHAREFFNDDGVLDVAEARAAQLFREDGAHVTKLAQLLHNGKRERLGFIPFKDMRADFGFRKFADVLAKFYLVLCVGELHSGAGV